MTDETEVTTPWTAGGVTKDRFVTGGDEREGIFSLGDVNIFPSAGPGPVAIAAGAEIAEQIIKAVNSHDALVGALTFILAFYEPGQRHLDTNAWKHAEAGARAALKNSGGFLHPVGTSGDRS